MLRTLSLLAVALTLGACATRPPEPAPADSFRLLTYNVCKENIAWQPTIEAIRKADADIVILQETTRDWEKQIRAELTAAYPTMAFHPTVSGRYGGSGFLSRVPAKDIAYIPSEATWFDGWIVRFETKSGPVQVLNVHLHPPVSEMGVPTVGAWFYTGEDRRRELIRFVAYTDPEIPLIIAGDFNDDDASAALEFLRKRGMINALQQFDPWTNTWRLAGAELIARRLDHVVYDPSLHCFDARVIQEGTSDHWPILTVIGKKPR